MQVQLDGIGAAISNLQYFHASISKAYVHCEVLLWYKSYLFVYDEKGFDC